MSDPQSILISNFIESLQQVHRYVVIGLGTSLSALALALAAPQRNGTEAPVAPLPGIFVAVDPKTALVLLLAICMVVGAMASYSAETAIGIASQLRSSSPELLNAARTFPSFATSQYPGVRYAAALLPLFFSLAATTVVAIRQTPAKWTWLWLGLIFLGAAYVPLALWLHRPIGAP